MTEDAGQAGAGQEEASGPGRASAPADSGTTGTTGGSGGTGEPGGPIGPGGPGGVAGQRRGQMLRAALDVITERGFADTRIADVAERIGISPALVIYYFKTKDQLLTEAIRYYEDKWYDDGKRRMDALPTAALRIEEFVAMNLLPAEDPDLESSPQVWLDFWVQAVRNPDVATLRQSSDERWRDVLVTLVHAGQAAGEFADIDADAFAIFLSALLDGMTVQTALGDPTVDPHSAFELCMRYVSGHLGFEWPSAGSRYGSMTGPVRGPVRGSRLDERLERAVRTMRRLAAGRRTGEPGRGAGSG